MLSIESIVTSFQQQWDAGTSLSAPTVYPGIQLATDSLDAWFELWINAWTSSPRRRAELEQLDVTIWVHCFAKHPTNMIQSEQLATVARENLEHRIVPILAANQSQVGLLVMGETETRRLSRQSEHGHWRWQHIAVVAQGTAHETGG